jgi:hypothetical protein
MQVRPMSLKSPEEYATEFCEDMDESSHAALCDLFKRCQAETIVEAAKAADAACIEECVALEKSDAIGVAICVLAPAVHP